MKKKNNLFNVTSIIFNDRFNTISKSCVTLNNEIFEHLPFLDSVLEAIVVSGGLIPNG